MGATDQLEWGSQGGGREQVMLGGQGAVPAGAGVAPARAAGGVQVLDEEAVADGSYEERQVLWEGMSGRSWLELVRQWGVSVHGGAPRAAEVDCSGGGFCRQLGQIFAGNPSRIPAVKAEALYEYDSKHRALIMSAGQ